MHTQPTLQRANLTGIVWMIAAMAAFAIEDAFIKIAAKQLPVGQLLMLFGAGGALFFAYLTRRSGAKVLIGQAWSRLMLIRAVCELVGRLFYVLAIALTPLSSATAILQVTPSSWCLVRCTSSARPSVGGAGAPSWPV